MLNMKTPFKMKSECNNYNKSILVHNCLNKISSHLAINCYLSLI